MINKSIYFLHIPKTAGSSTVLLLDKHFQENEIFPYKRWIHIFEKNSLSEAKKLFTNNKYKLFRGHFGYHPQLVSGKFVFTMLRNPLTRTHSEFKHILRSPTDNWTWPGYIRNKDEKLSDILADKTRASYITNVQVRYLSSNYNPLNDPVKKISTQIPFDSQEKFVKTTVLHPKISLAIALYRLIKIDFFGLQEFWEESMYMLSEKLNINDDLPTERVHTYERETSLTDVDSYTSNLLYYTNNLDVIFYAIAKRIFLFRFKKYLNKVLGKEIDFYEYLSHRDVYLPQIDSKRKRLRNS